MDNRTSAVGLNRDISPGEVAAALKEIKNGKSPGLERAQGECHKYALRSVLMAG